MNLKLKRFKSKAMFTFVGGVLLINPAFAQSNQDEDQDQATQLDAMVVTGLRNSLNQSMGIKRDAFGVVDAISAEDIGKFPDTNLAESLQRITGISIERRDGEGAQITARGFGPQFNMITLNGRQLPGVDGFSNGDQVTGGQGSGTRAFNFAQLASEAVSAVEVYKTGRADVPSGGIGATVDIQTDRPLYHTGLRANVGAKSLYDDSAPFDNEFTPEVSGIFSYTNDDKTWGVGLSASYQERHGGSVQATENTWNMQRWNGTSSALRPGAVVENAPAIGQLYGMPNDLRYAFSDFERERTNAQGVLQFAPSDSLTLTLDYTYARNEIAEDRGEQTIWLQRSNSFTHLTFDTGREVATPIYLRDIVGGKDFGYEQQRNEQEYKLDSLGFNAVWQVTDNFSLTFDGHDSESSSNPNDPLTGGSATFFSFAGTNCVTTNPFTPQAAGSCPGGWAQEFAFNTGLPIASRTFYPTVADAVAGNGGTLNPDFGPNQLASQILRIWYTRQDTEIQQGRIDGNWEFDEGRFQFGVDSSEVTATRFNTSGQATLGDWGAADAGLVPGMVALLQPFSLSSIFSDYNTNGIPTGAWRGQASVLAQWAVNSGAVHPSTGAPYGRWNDASMQDGQLTYDLQADNDNRIKEKTDSVYLQVEMEGSFAGLPTYTRAGVRYEKTDIVSTSSIAIPSEIVWQANNDFFISRSADFQPFSEKASYSYVLPNLDFSIDLTADIKARTSFSQTIARPGYGSLYAGPTPNNPTGSILIDSSTRASAEAQSPSLSPLESDNLDIALEWYFAETSFLSVTFFDKRVDNFIGNTVVRESLYGLRDPTAGPDAQAALDFLLGQTCRQQVTAAGNDVEAACSANDTALFTALAMLRNAGETGGLGAYNGSSTQILQMENNYDLVGEADDPLYLFDVNRPVNQNKAKIHGWEIGGQYFFGDSGFGIFANYTIVDGDVGFDNTVTDVDQFALLGLSDTANAVFMYEKFGWSVRLAYNWRDEYLIATNQNGSNRNPYYVEEYEQWDLSVNYQWNERLSFGFEGINLTGEDVRWHGRSDLQVIKLIDQEPRYLVGFRYKF